MTKQQLETVARLAAEACACGDVTDTKGTWRENVDSMIVEWTSRRGTPLDDFAKSQIAKLEAIKAVAAFLDSIGDGDIPAVVSKSLFTPENGKSTGEIRRVDEEANRYVTTRRK